MKTAIYPGSFDPITNGHLDILKSGSEIFDKVIIAVSYNANKKGFLSIDERVDLIKKSVAELTNVEVDCFEGLTVEYAKSKNEDPFVIIADEIEDPHNLGALIRTAETAGCHGIIIPKRRACQVTEVVVKVSCGATEHLPIARVNNINDAIEELKEKGLWIVGTDGSAKELYYEQDLKGPIGIVIGSEGRGMSKLTMKNCDFLVKIPMFGEITSLNASVSGGIIIYEAVRQRRDMSE